MKLSEVAATNYVKALVYGPSSTGKTVFACSFPTPILYMDFDNKISSAAQFYKNDKERLEGITVNQYAKMSRDTRCKQFIADLNAIQKLQYAKAELPFKTIVIDSLTTFTSYLLDDYIHVSQKAIKRALEGVNAMQDYQLLDKHLTQIIPGILSLDANVVFIGHLCIDRDETTGAISNRPLMSGKFADKLPIFFEEVYVSKVDASGKYMMQTHSDPRTVCRTQRKLPKEIESSYDSIIKNTK